ncbi:hypothetical protein IM816_05965 [Luteibacter flocculans]|uniref:Uncharacterized protein n=1 Tax=Luteibacter flocculans TaxID=2780091 RepID=A0ABY4T402_9GAMM|nr:hypothetical protein [Luteibacter flocculans]URL59642.1 hypothetical protein IM816_05965 [Luteibacter flocculans]
MPFNYKLPIEEMERACQGIQIHVPGAGAVDDPRPLDEDTEALCDSMFHYLSSDENDHTYAASALTWKYASAAFEGYFPIQAPIRDSQLAAGTLIAHIALVHACRPFLLRTYAWTQQCLRAAFRVVERRAEEDLTDRKRFAAKKGVDQWREPVRALVIGKVEAASDEWSASRLARELSGEVLEVAKAHGRSLSPYNVEGTIRKMIGKHRRETGRG